MTTLTWECSNTFKISTKQMKVMRNIVFTIPLLIIWPTNKKEGYQFHKLENLSNCCFLKAVNCSRVCDVYERYFCINVKCEHCLLAKINKFWQWVVLHKWLPKLKFKKQNKDNYAHDDTHTLYSYPKKWAIQNVCVFQLWVLNSRWYVCPILTSTHKSIRIKNSNPTSSSLD